MIVGWEWIIVILVIVAVILWGPQKIPELARALGKARAEFSKAAKEVEEVATLQTEPVKSQPPKPAPPPPPQGTSSEDVLIETAKKLGISTEGKTIEQISNEIVEKVGKSD